MVLNVLLSERQRKLVAYVWPALGAAAIAWIAFMALGHTPLLRASGLALVIGGVTLTVRRLGALLAITGGLALAFSPAFWSQTGGAESLSLLGTLVVVALASATALIGLLASKKLMLGFGLGLVVFVLLFWSHVATFGSLRLTTLLTAWLIYLLIDALRRTNPRPDDPPPTRLRPYHTFGFLLLLALGVMNDPLFTLLTPAAALTVVLSRQRLPVWYWITLLMIVGVGLRGLAVQYLDSGWWLYPAAQAEEFGIRVPYVMADAWRVASRWIGLFALVIEQFTAGGLLLGVIGLARLSRWYPSIGIVTLVAYAAYGVFGLVYFGKNSDVLLLPLLMIQVLWMTYAVYAFGQWLQKSLAPARRYVAWVAPAAFTLLPLLLFLRIASPG